MFNMEEMPEELRKYGDLSVFCDLYRITDPETCKIYNYAEGKLLPQKEFCYNVWERKKACSNCSSRRAVMENRTIVKLECFVNRAMLVYSVPVSINNKKYSLELIKNVTDSFVIKFPLHNENEILAGLINSVNSIITHDPFTGLHNKYYTYKELHRLIDSAAENNYTFSAAFIDIDKFKIINDTYGHVKGDEVIKEIAEYIKKITDEGKVFGARMGGDEFMIIFSKMTFEKSEKLCGELMNKVSEHEFCARDGQKFHVQISYGLHEFDKNLSKDEFINHIDEKMYNMKRSKLNIR